MPHRAALTATLFVLKTGVPWEDLPAEMGCGCGMMCWRRLHGWHQAGVWAELHRVLLGRLDAAGQLDWSRAALDSVSVAAKKGTCNGAEPNGPRQAGTNSYSRRFFYGRPGCNRRTRSLNMPDGVSPYA